MPTIQEKQNTPNPTLSSQLQTQIHKKAPGILASYPFDLMTSAILNNGYNKRPLSNTFRTMSGLTLGLSFAEHIAHRGGKVIGQCTALELTYDRPKYQRVVVSTGTVCALEGLIAAPLNKVMSRAQVGDLTTSNLYTIFNQPYRGAIPYMARGAFFTAFQSTALVYCEDHFKSPLSKMPLQEQLISVAAGALAGTLGAAPTTFLTSIQAVQNISLKESIHLFLKNPIAAYNPRLVGAKAVLKVATHSLQYTGLLQILGSLK